MHYDDIETNDVLNIQNKFRKAHRELDYIRVKVSQKKGILFFKRHVYTTAELLQSEHHNKIHAITGKIGDDVMHWYKAGKLTDGGKRAYYEEKRKVEDNLHSINLEIERREPTWWEEVCDVFEAFAAIIGKNMPELVRTLLDNVANYLRFPAQIRKLLRLPVMDNMKLLVE